MYVCMYIYFFINCTIVVIRSPKIQNEVVRFRVERASSIPDLHGLGLRDYEV